MHWKEQLKAKIESLTDKDWLSFTNQAKYAAIYVDSGHDPQDIQRFSKFISHVNDRKFCDVDRGLLQFTGWSWDTRSHLEFCLRKTVPWNVLPDYEIGVFREILDSHGKPAHNYFDFDSLP